jgi:hypothetical protein
MLDNFQDKYRVTTLHLSRYQPSLAYIANEKLRKTLTLADIIVTFYYQQMWCNGGVIYCTAIFILCRFPFRTNYFHRHVAEDSNAHQTSYVTGMGNIRPWVTWPNSRLSCIQGHDSKWMLFSLIHGLINGTGRSYITLIK